MTVREWVYEREITGHSTFSHAEVALALPSYSRPALSTELKWIYRKQIPEELILERNSEGGIVRYSSPELTMMDLVQYKHFVGGLGMAATIIAELSESIDFSTSALSRVFPVVTGSTVQRAGYILEEVLGEKEKADLLHEIYKDYGARMEWILLEPAAKKPPAFANWLSGAASARYADPGMEYHYRKALKPWDATIESGRFLYVGEFGVWRMTPHETALAFMEDVLSVWKDCGIGWALWNLRGDFGVLDSNRADVEYEDFRGHKLDRKMLDLLRRM